MKEPVDALPYRLDPADASSRLSPEDREKLRTGFDADALERLLSMVIPDVRPELLRAFQWPPRGESPPNIMYFKNDPALNAVLDEVWLPMWEQVSPESMDSETKEFPGLALARRRRAAG
jgi:hypothetical protein